MTMKGGMYIDSRNIKNREGTKDLSLQLRQLEEHFLLLKRKNNLGFPILHYSFYIYEL